MSKSKTIRMLARTLARQNTHLLEEQKRRELDAMALQLEESDRRHQRMDRVIDHLSLILPTLISPSMSGASAATGAETSEPHPAPRRVPVQGGRPVDAALEMAVQVEEIETSLSTTQMQKIMSALGSYQQRILVELFDSARKHRAEVEAQRGNRAQSRPNPGQDAEATSSS